MIGWRWNGGERRVNGNEDEGRLGWSSTAEARRVYARSRGAEHSPPIGWSEEKEGTVYFVIICARQRHLLQTRTDNHGIDDVQSSRV